MGKFRDRFDKRYNVDYRYAKICRYAAITVLSILIIIMLLQASAPAWALAWNLVCAVLKPMAYGLAVALAMNPLVEYMSRRLRKYRRYANDPARCRSLAVILSVALVVLFLLAIIAVMVLMVTRSISSLSLDSVMALFGDARGDLTELIAQVQEKLRSIGLLPSNGESGFMSIFSGVSNAASTALFAVIFGIYFLLDGQRVSEYLYRVLNAIAGESSLFDFSSFAQDAKRVFAGYFRGQGIDALIVGALAGVVLTAIGVPYGPVIGLLTGLGNMIPYVGGPVGFGSVAIMCLPGEQWGKMIAGFVAMAVVMFVDGNIINPRLLSNNVEVHPILVIAALIAGGAVGGLVGMVMAVPVAAFLKIQVDRWVEKRENELAQTAEEAAEAEEEDLQ